MEFNCPGCDKRLRAPDHLPNPLVRCRTCGATFRPREGSPELPQDSTALFEESASLPQATELPQYQPESFRRLEPVSAGKSLVAKGLGIGVMVLLIALAKAPRLVKLLLPDNPPPPAPVRIDERQLQMLRDMQDLQRKRVLPAPPNELRRFLPNADPFEDPLPLAPAPKPIVEPEPR
jgi:hypothetical protein